jgi:hypothetical protein
MWINDTFSMIVLRKIPKFTKRCKLSYKILPGNESIPLGVKLFINLVELPVTAGYSVSQVRSELGNDYFLITLWEKVE